MSTPGSIPDGNYYIASQATSTVFVVNSGAEGTNLTAAALTNSQNQQVSRLPISQRKIKLLKRRLSGL
jgi:hypothetical protein